MSDFCDGKVCVAHPLFSLHKDALQILFYFDELEICNPLGTKSKIHKLGKVHSYKIECYVYACMQVFSTLHWAICPPSTDLV